MDSMLSQFSYRTLSTSFWMISQIRTLLKKKSKSSTSRARFRSNLKTSKLRDCFGSLGMWHLRCAASKNLGRPQVELMKFFAKSLQSSLHCTICRKVVVTTRLLERGNLNGLPLKKISQQRLQLFFFVIGQFESVSNLSFV